MKRKIITIDREKCNGCGACVSACHEGAIGMIDGKAALLREDYCDGLGDCLPVCPTDAITMEERDAPAYDEEAVRAGAAAKGAHTGICMGRQARALRSSSAPSASGSGASVSRLAQWPCQIKLIPTQAPYLDGADLLVAADCTAYAYGAFHEDFMRGRITLIGCPKLDAVDYTEKLCAILSSNRVASLCVLRMEVPCCSGIEHAARRALLLSGKEIPFRVVTISTEGKIL
jgi:NAD-dependent dihydropyrimidine dehydrogenase PreA subunit